MSDYLANRRNRKLFGKPEKEKKTYYIPKVSKKKQEEMAANKEGRGEMDEWFGARRKEMTGECVLCSGKTEKDNDETFKRSIHHILEKRPTMFPSVAKHPDNWLEVCFFGNSCHTNLHNGTITMELLRDSAEWKIIVDKFKKIYPYIAEAEKKNIPELLLKELSK